MIEDRRGMIEAALAMALGKEEPGELYAPAQHVLEAQGKRLRPLLAILTCEMFGGKPEQALPAAVAVEVFHTFTLVHDDIMDKADSRRGRVTVHVKWDTPTAILVGDLLMGIAYEQLSRLQTDAVAPALVSFSGMVRKLCEGQTLDMAFESREQVSLEDYLEMIDGKTGALLAASMELGAIAAGATPDERNNIAEAGKSIGRAFQIQDDLLDLTAESASWGKRVGGDLLEGKKTWLLIQTLNRAESADMPLLNRVLAGELEESEIQSVRMMMERLDVLKDTRNAVIFHSDAAIGRLRAEAESPARDELIALVRSMQARIH